MQKCFSKKLEEIFFLQCSKTVAVSTRSIGYFWACEQDLSSPGDSSTSPELVVFLYEQAHVSAFVLVQHFCKISSNSSNNVTIELHKLGRGYFLHFSIKVQVCLIKRAFLFKCFILLAIACSISQSMFQNIREQSCCRCNWR